MTDREQVARVRAYLDELAARSAKPRAGVDPDEIHAFGMKDGVLRLIASDIRALLRERDAAEAGYGAFLQEFSDWVRIARFDNQRVLADSIASFAPHYMKALAEHDAKVRAEAEAPLLELLRWVHETLWEINPSNYDHDDVCKLNAASVEAILGIAPTLEETHGKSPEWWAAREQAND